MEENNKIIAEFMGVNNITSYVLKRAILEDLNYHSDWNELMEVVDKIEEMDIVASFQIENPTIYIWASSESDSFEDIEIDIFNKTKIEAVYEAVVKFINFYNKQKEI